MPITPRAPRRAALKARDVLLVAGAVVLTGMIIGVPLAVKALVPPPEEADHAGCLKVSPAHLVVVIDASDPLPSLVRQAARSTIADAFRQMPDFGRISVYHLTGDAAQPLRLAATGCRTPEVRQIDAWIGDADPYERGRRSAGKAVEKADTALSTERSLDDSPILQGVVKLTRQAFAPQQANRKLILVSDLLQRTPGLDLYRKDLTLADVVARNRWNALPDLDKAEVVVLQVLGRWEDPQGARAAAAERFWCEVFSAAGAGRAVINPVAPTKAAAKRPRVCSPLAEHPREHDVDVLDVVAEVEQGR